MESTLGTYNFIRLEKGRLTSKILHFQKSLIRFKSPGGVQTTSSLMGKVRNIVAIDVGRNTKNAMNQRLAFIAAKAIWDDATQRLLTA